MSQISAFILDFEKIKNNFPEFYKNNFEYIKKRAKYTLYTTDEASDYQKYVKFLRMEASGEFDRSVSILISNIISSKSNMKSKLIKLTLLFMPHEDLFKKHLKNRNLIKFKSYDTIESISKLRNMDVKINKDLLDSFVNEDKLPWPGFFIGQELNNNYKLLSYEVLNNIYFCKISGIEMSVPYNSNFFIFENDNLTLLDSSLTI